MAQVGSLYMLAGYDQSDRIQSMALYMNQGMASGEWLTLLFIFGGMLGIVLLLKIVASANRHKSEQARKVKAKARKAARALEDRKGPPMMKRRGRATRLR
ncbi:hypothetical protein [Reinekea sp.]|uniref:hypothetical protein n=1 Tax=Reinekea sp. TaxID=1970455 RepID=UPI002A7FBFE7|nr:hypothetical protein [Reinekea sp.]